jgi:hypothetical protein
MRGAEGGLVKRAIAPGLHVRPLVSELFLTENCNLRCISCNCWLENTPEDRPASTVHVAPAALGLTPTAPHYARGGSGQVAETA